MTVETIAKSFGTALLYWVGFYAIIVHLFVIWKWESYAVSPRTSVVSQTKKETVTLYEDQSNMWSQITQATKSEIEATQTMMRSIGSKQALLQQSLDDMIQTLDNLVEKQKNLENLENEVSLLTENLVIFRDGTEAPEQVLGYFEGLAAVPDLGEIKNLPDLKRAFTLVIDGLDKQMNRVDEVEWSALNRLFAGIKHPERVSEMTACPEIPEQNKEEEKEEPKSDVTITQTNETVLTEEDLVARQEEIRAIWDQVYEDKPLPVTDNEIKRLENVRQKLVDAWLVQVQASYDKSIDSLEEAIANALETMPDEETVEEEPVHEDVNCAKTNDVLAVLETGIEAMYRKQDLQEALQKAMSARDPELRNVILDADLPMGESRPEIVGPATLRQYLDVAMLTHDVPGWIHGLLDLTGGHWDVLDNAIDRLPENAGEVAVKNVLVHAGKYDLDRIQGGIQDSIASLKTKVEKLTS